MSNTNPEVALRWAALRIPVFPCRPHDDANGRAKSPYIRWRDQGVATEDEIRGWWTRWPEAIPAINIGAADLVVIDCDRHGGPDGVANFLDLCKQQGIDLSAVPSVTTATGGRHFFFRQPDGGKLNNSPGALPPGVEVRGVGGYLIAPGATRVGVGAYEPTADTPDVVAAVATGTVPTIPDALLAVIQARASKAPKPAEPAQPSLLVPLVPGAMPDDPALFGAAVEPDGLSELDLSSNKVRRSAIEEGSLASARWRGLLADLHAELAAAQPGSRNNKMNAIGFRAGRIAAGNGFPPEEAFEALMDAAHRNGLVGEDGRAAVEGSLYRSIAEGMKKPAPLADRQLRSPNGSHPTDGQPASQWIVHGDAPRPRPDWLIKKTLPRVGVAQLVGTTGVGKSAFAMRLAATVITGGALFDNDVVRTGGVLWFAAEAAEEVDTRLEALTVLGLLSRAAPFAHVPEVSPILGAEGERLLLQCAEAGAAKLQDRFGVKPALIVIDTAVAAAGYQDENDNAEAQRLMNILQRLARAQNCLVLIVDHYGKGGQEKGTRGASAKDGAADARLEIQRAGEDGGRVELTKLRGGPARPLGRYELKAVDIGTDDDGQVETAVVAELRQNGAAQKRPPPKGAVRVQAAVDKVVADGKPVDHASILNAYLAAGHKREAFRRDFRTARTFGLLPTSVVCDEADVDDRPPAADADDT
jgi:hypothetical protein